MSPMERKINNLRTELKEKSFKRDQQFSFDKRAIDEEARTVEVAFSSEKPVMRWFGNEILDQSRESVRLERLNNGGAVLVDHDTRDHVGVVESARIDNDRVGRAVLRFGRAQRAEDIFRDVVDGIRSLVSFMYVIHDLRLESSSDDGEDTYRSNDWEPLEISIVSIPADETVGVGRSREDVDEKVKQAKQEERKMPEAVAVQEPNAGEISQARMAELERQAKADAQSTELERIRTISSLGAKFGRSQEAEAAVQGGTSAEEFQRSLLDSLSRDNQIVAADSAEVGLTDKEVREFSFCRAIHALSNPQDQRAREAAAFEFEVSNAAAVARKKEARGFLVPVDILGARNFATMKNKRDLTVGTAADGGNLVATDLVSGSFIELLRNVAVFLSRATILDDLTGNVAIPKQTGSATSYWVAEGGTPTESQQTIGQVTLNPKTVGAYTDFSRRLMLQSSISTENFVRADLLMTVALALDLAGIAGTGASNQPTGILNTSGIGDVAGGTDGAAPTFANIVDLETAVAVDNALLGDLAYMVNAKTRGKLKKTAVESGYPDKVWDNRSGDTPLNGYSAATTNQVPSNLTKGSGTDLSAILFGNWSSAIVGLWSGIDIMVNPYHASESGLVRVSALQDADIAVRHPESFAAMQDAITT